MSEVALLQLIGLTVVGLGICILLFIKGKFLRVVGFVVIVLGTFTLIALGVPQMASLPPAIETFDIAEVKTPDDLACICHPSAMLSAPACHQGCPCDRILVM